MPTINIKSVSDTFFFDSPSGPYIEAIGKRSDSGQNVTFQIHYDAFLEIMNKAGAQIHLDAERKNDIRKQFRMAAAGIKEVAA